MKKIIIPAICLILLTSCQQNTPKTNQEATNQTANAAQNDATKPPAASPYDTMLVATRLTAQNKTFIFTAAESFDRCDAVSVKRRDKKPMKISKEFQSFLDCIAYSSQIIDDRYMVFFNDKNVLLQDMETNTTRPLFTAQSYDDANLVCVGWSPDKTRVAFVSTVNDPDTQKKLGYPTHTRLIVLQMNADKTAVIDKTKYDIAIQFFVTEGDFISREDCFWVNNTTIGYRNFVSTDFEEANNAPKKYTNLDISK